MMDQDQFQDPVNPTEQLDDQEPELPPAVPDEDITSSFENIVPPQVKKGFGVFFNWAASTASMVKDKAVEINNSETVQTMKTRTAAAVHQAGEAAAPIWEKTKESLTVAAEITSEKATQAAETLQPTLDAVSSQLSETANASWTSFSRVAAKWMDVEPDGSDDRQDAKLHEDVDDVPPAFMSESNTPPHAISQGPLVL